MLFGSDWPLRVHLCGSPNHGRMISRIKPTVSCQQVNVDTWTLPSAAGRGSLDTGGAC